MSCPIRPLKGQVVVERLPQSRTRDKESLVATPYDDLGCPYLGLVEAVGEEVAEVGLKDEIFFDSVMGREVVCDGKTWVVVDERDVVATLDDKC